MITFGQIIADGTYQIYSQTHDAILESPTDVNQDDSGDGTINNLFGTISDISNPYQLFEFVHQGSNVYKIKNVGTDQFIGIKDNWCGNGGEVIARYEEVDTNVEFSVSQDATSGQFIIQIAFTTCNFGSENSPARSFDLGSSSGKVRTFGDTGGNQQFRLKAVSPAVTNGIYRLFTEANNQFVASPTDVMQDDSGDATINNLFTTTFDTSNDYQEFEFTYKFTNQNGDIYTIRNLGTNQYVGLKDNFCGNFGEVIARFGENDNEAQIVVSKDEGSGRVLFQKDDASSCSYFDLSGTGKIRTFSDTGFNQQFRVISTNDLLVYDNAWSPSAPLGTGTENVVIKNGTYTTSSNVAFNSILVLEGASIAISASDVLTVAEFVNNNGSFTFKSNASGAAQLADATGVSIRGNISVERFIPKRSDDARAFRFLSSAVNGVNIADSWQLNTHITGATGTVGETSADGFDETVSGAPSMFTFDHLVEEQNQPWLAIPTTEQDIEAGKPYRLFVRGDRSVSLSDNDAAANDVTLSATGDLFTGNHGVTTSNFSENFTFVGNPYQAVVNLNNLIYGDGVNNNFAYYWDPSLDAAGGFVVVSLPGGAPNPGTSNANNFLRPGQAIFVRNNDVGTDYSIQFTEASKAVTGGQSQVFSTTSIPFVNLRLYTSEKFNSNGSEEDAVGIRFYENGNNAIDQMDAVKMGNPGVNLAIVNGNTPLAIESRAIPDELEEIQLFMNNLNSDNYIFRFHSENMPENTNVFINDTYLETKTELEEGIDSYLFSIDNSIDASASPLRFKLIFEASTLNINHVDATLPEIAVYPNPTTNNLFIKSSLFKDETVSAKVVDVLGRVVWSAQSLSSETEDLNINVEGLIDGVYFIAIQTSKGEEFKRKFIKH
jgi:hypothetical protein